MFNQCVNSAMDSSRPSTRMTTLSIENCNIDRIRRDSPPSHFRSISGYTKPYA